MSAKYTLATTSERSHGDAMPKKLAGSCNGEAKLLTCQSIILVYGSLVQHLKLTLWILVLRSWWMIGTDQRHEFSRFGAKLCGWFDQLEP
jgi:hypothetical protein